MDSTEVAVNAPAEKDLLDLYSDRELLLYIARNMVTPESVVQVATEKLPEILTSLENSPVARTILKFLK